MELLLYDLASRENNAKKLVVTEIDDLILTCSTFPQLYNLRTDKALTGHKTITGGGGGGGGGGRPDHIALLHDNRGKFEAWSSLK